jgi:hypothetical protein
VPALGFPHDGGEVTAAETEALLDPTADPNSRPVARDAVPLAKNPHPAGTIINFEDSGSQRAERSGHVARYGDFFPHVPSWIAIDSFDAGARRASRQNQAPHENQQGERNPAKQSDHTILPYLKLTI